MQAAKGPQAGSEPAGGGTSSGIYEAGRVGEGRGRQVSQKNSLGREGKGEGPMRVTSSPS